MRAPEGGLRVGRRLAGLILDPVEPTDDPRGAYFATLLQLQTASIDAFYSLRDELRAASAPPRLVRGAERAAHDETKHVPKVARLAARFGARASTIRISPPQPRPIVELAIENATEGCVRETYGAVEARLQADAVSDPEINATLKLVSRDEARHSSLAWQIDGWLTSRLTAVEKARVDAAMRDAVLTLLAQLATRPDPALMTSLGLPSPPVALAAAQDLDERMWRARLA